MGAVRSDRGGGWLSDQYPRGHPPDHHQPSTLHRPPRLRHADHCRPTSVTSVEGTQYRQAATVVLCGCYGRYGVDERACFGKRRVSVGWCGARIRLCRACCSGYVDDPGARREYIPSYYLRTIPQYYT